MPLLPKMTPQDINLASQIQALLMQPCSVNPNYSSRDEEDFMRQASPDPKSVFAKAVENFIEEYKLQAL